MDYFGFEDEIEKQIAFEEVIHDKDFVRHTYFYLMSKEDVFTNLIDFIFLLDDAIEDVAREIETKCYKLQTIQNLVEKDSFYVRKYKFTDFEASLLKYLVAVYYYEEDQSKLESFGLKAKFEHFCNLIFKMVEQNKEKHKYLIHYKTIKLANGRNKVDWSIELNEISNISNSTINISDNPNTPITEMQTKNIIIWKNDQIELAYLFWILKKENIIQSDTLAKSLSTIFFNNEAKRISNVLLNSYFSKFEKRDSFPKNANEIEALIKLLKKPTE
jgi:hypothetical protein